MKTRDEFIMEHDVLYHYWTRGPGDIVECAVLQLVVPREHRMAIIYQYHDSPLAGHRKSQNTYLAIRLKYYWPTLPHDVRDWVDSCVAVCTR